MANKISLGLVLALSQHRGGPFLHGVHGKHCDEISVEELPAGYDKVIHSSCLREVCTLVQELTNQRWFLVLFCNRRFVVCFDEFKDAPKVGIFSLRFH